MYPCVETDIWTGGKPIPIHYEIGDIQCFFRNLGYLGHVSDSLAVGHTNIFFVNPWLLPSCSLLKANGLTPKRAHNMKITVVKECLI